MQKAVLVLLSFLFLFSLASAAGAQNRNPAPAQTPKPAPSPTPSGEPKPLPCPMVNIQSPAGYMVKDGQPVTFAVTVAGGDPKVVPTLVWSVSAGTIREGQGTQRLVVDSTGAGSSPDRQITAEVWIGGYAPECVLQARASAKILAPAVKFGEFGEVDPERLAVNIKALADFLAQSPDSIYVIAYAGRKSERGFAFNWIKRIRTDLEAAGVAPRRIAGIDGGFREEPLFDFWLVPTGAEPPRPAPTVDRREIVYPKAPPKKP